MMQFGPKHDGHEPAARYRVELGHSSVTVNGVTVQEALRAARLMLCRELPRMWDVIQSLDESRFRVIRLG